MDRDLVPLEQERLAELEILGDRELSLLEEARDAGALGLVEPPPILLELLRSARSAGELGELARSSRK